MRLPTSMLSVPTLAGVGLFVSGLMTCPSLAQDHAGHDHSAQSSPSIIGSEAPDKNVLLDNLYAGPLFIDHARKQIRPASLVSYIDARNTRSIALAKRLGATPDPAAARHEDGDVVYRHAVAA